MKREAWEIRQDFLTALLILILPVLDIYKSVVGNRFELFGFSMVEILNGCFALFFVIILIIRSRHTGDFMRYLKETAAILLVLGIYLIGHLLNIRKFQDGLLTTTDINLFVEIYHIAISYLFPAVVLYVFCNLRLSPEKTAKLLMYQGLVISGLIVVTNLLGVSFVAYSSYYENDTIIAGSIFDWGKHLASCPDVNLYTSRGFFYSANQISAILSGLTLLTAVWAVHHNKIAYYGVLTVDFLALLMLSTKTGLLAIGASFVLCYAYPAYQWLRTGKKLFTAKSLVIPLCLMGMIIGLYTISPVRYKLNAYLRTSTEDKSSLEIGITIPTIAPMETEPSSTVVPETMDPSSTVAPETVESNQTASSAPTEALETEPAVPSETQQPNASGHVFSDEELVEELQARSTNYGIPSDYITLYSVRDHIDFWRNLLDQPFSVTSNFRTVKTMIYEDVLQKNQNVSGDRLWGIGYTSGFPEIERDIITQNIYYGYLGTAVLIAPFLLILLVCGIRILIFAKKYAEPEFYALIFAGAFITLASFITGHVFGCFVPNAILAILLGTLVSAFRQKKQDREN